MIASLTQASLLGERTFITDGGLETELVFNEQWDLPEFASFVLLDSASGMASLMSYYQRYVDIATTHNAGLVLESPTWRASPGWGKKIGYNELELAGINRRAIDVLSELRAHNQHADLPILLSGCIGPHGDGYAPAEQLSIEQALEYHRFQTKVFAHTDADLLCAMTITYVEEAIGLVIAAREVNMPIVISFTVETDGKLPCGISIAAAIAAVDKATDYGPLYYMINCAHPTHFSTQLAQGGGWLKRIGGIRANASCKSHAELDEATELDRGNPADLGQQYKLLATHLPNLQVVGGCCGTNHEHVDAVAEVLLS